MHEAHASESFDDFYRRLFKREPSTQLHDDGGYAYFGEAYIAHKVWWALKNTTKHEAQPLDKCTACADAEGDCGRHGARKPEISNHDVRTVCEVWGRSRITPSNEWRLAVFDSEENAKAAIDIWNKEPLPHGQTGLFLFASKVNRIEDRK